MELHGQERDGEQRTREQARREGEESARKQQEDEKREYAEKHKDKPVVPMECSEAYEMVIEAARLCKRSRQMSPDWWINFCKHAWDESVED